MSICSGALSAQPPSLQSFSSLCGALHYRHPTGHETRLFPLVSLSDDPVSSFCAILRAEFCPARDGVRLRAKADDLRNPQRWKNQRGSLPRRATEGRGTIGTEKVGRHHHRRSPRRGPRKSRMGTQAGRIAGHALRAHPRQRLVSANERTGGPISLSFPQRPKAKSFRALPLRRRPHRRIRCHLSHGFRKMACRTSPEGDVFFRIQRFLAPGHEIVHPRFSCAPELRAGSGLAPRAHFTPLIQTQLLAPSEIETVSAVWRPRAWRRYGSIVLADLTLSSSRRPNSA